MDASVEAVYGDIVLKFKKLLVEEGGNDMVFDAPQNLSVFSGTVGEVHGSNRGKAVINIILGGTLKVSDPNQGKYFSHGILIGLAWGFFMLLDVGSALLQDLLPPGTTWFKIH